MRATTPREAGWKEIPSGQLPRDERVRRGPKAWPYPLEDVTLSHRVCSALPQASAAAGRTKLEVWGWCGPHPPDDEELVVREVGPVHVRHKQIREGHGGGRTRTIEYCKKSARLICPPP